MIKCIHCGASYHNSNHLKCVVCGRGIAPWVMHNKWRKREFLSGSKKVDGSDWRDYAGW